LKICKAQIITIKLKKIIQENITKNWNTTRLIEFCIKNIANISNRIKKKESKKININKLNN